MKQLTIRGNVCDRLAYQFWQASFRMSWAHLKFFRHFSRQLTGLNKCIRHLTGGQMKICTVHWGHGQSEETAHGHFSFYTEYSLPALDGAINACHHPTVTSRVHNWNKSYIAKMLLNANIPITDTEKGSKCLVITSAPGSAQSVK